MDGAIETLNQNFFRSIYKKNFGNKLVIENKLSLSDRRGKSMQYPESPKVTPQPSPTYTPPVFFIGKFSISYFCSNFYAAKIMSLKFCNSDLTLKNCLLKNLLLIPTILQFSLFRLEPTSCLTKYLNWNFFEGASSIQLFFLRKLLQQRRTDMTSFCK